MARITHLLLGALFAVLATPAAAQPAPGPAGEAPNFSGYWQLDGRTMGLIQNPSKPGPHGLPRGWMQLRGWANNEEPPLRPEMFEWVARRMQSELDGEVIDHRTLKCLPPNNFDIMTWGEPVDIVQRPDVVTILHEKERALPRRIYIGAQHPPREEIGLTANGHSIGWWEGDTLVADTIGLDPDTWLIIGDFIPHSEELHVRERIRMEDNGQVLTIQWVFTDPKTFTRPWTVNVRYNRLPSGTEAVESVCDIGQRAVELGH